MNLNRLWESMVCATADELKRNGWIINCSLETVEFYVFNADDPWRVRLTANQGTCSAW